jgi:molecular chaperone DnaK (HSP70)
MKSVVICLPATFTARQCQDTAKAITDAGTMVTRTLKEPAAAALAFELHR